MEGSSKTTEDSSIASTSMTMEGNSTRRKTRTSTSMTSTSRMMEDNSKTMKNSSMAVAGTSRMMEDTSKIMKERRMIRANTSLGMEDSSRRRKYNSKTMEDSNIASISRKDNIRRKRSSSSSKKITKPELTESKPFRSLSELYNALEAGLPQVPIPIRYMKELGSYVISGSSISSQNLYVTKLNKLDMPKTLLCHDMKGGYLEDKFFWGSTSHDSYLFYHWNVIDIFVYFSHHFVTIPPCGWINTAHHHGVKVLGTVITEGNNNTWNLILKSDNSIRKFANALVEIAKYYNFEGWLLNVENKIQIEDVNGLHYFLDYLTRVIHREINHSEIIWYDSVIDSGELSWQNELNDENKKFFLACDGIFLNYNWTEEKLMKSCNFAKKLACDVTNVYVGLDVWGRGCPGGGGLRSAYALSLIRKYKLSVAIFAPGWTHEYFGPKTFPKLENIFWAQLYPYLYVHVVNYTNETFKTTFCQGSGFCYFYEGQEYFDLYRINGRKDNREKTFYNLRIQQLQLSVPVPYLEFTHLIRTITHIEEVHQDDKENSNDNINENINASNDDKNDKKLRTSLEYIHESDSCIVRVHNKVIKIENKRIDTLNTFELCKSLSYQGGGCLKTITKNYRLYQRLFLIDFDMDRDIQATIIYADFEKELDSSKSPILILGNGEHFKLIISFCSVQLNDIWKKGTYLPNFNRVEEIGVLFYKNCECYLGEISLHKRDACFTKSAEASINRMILEYDDDPSKLVVSDFSVTEDETVTALNLSLKR